MLYCPIHVYYKVFITNEEVTVVILYRKINTITRAYLSFVGIDFLLYVFITSYNTITYCIDIKYYSTHCS